MTERGPKVLIAASKWWPLSARLAIALRRAGCHVGAVCPAHHPLTFVSGVERVHPYVGFASVRSLQHALRTEQPDYVVPCDDGVVAQLHAVHEQSPELRPLIEASLGPPSSYPFTTHRYQLMQLAVELGIPAPTTRQIERADDLERLWDQIGPAGVLKIDGESGGNGVRICRSVEQARAAWRELQKKPSLYTAWKRMAIDRDPLAHWSRRHGRARAVTIQRFVDGRPANSMFAALRGRLLGIVSVVVATTDGPTGAAMIVRKIDDVQMRNAASEITARLGLTGFYGLDFMLDAATETPYLIELNPRCTQLGHLEFADQPSLAETFVAALVGRAVAPPHGVIARQAIAFFPNGLEVLDRWHRDCGAAYVDEPTGEAALTDELKRPPWPHRHWLARFYHSFRPILRADAIDFETIRSTGGGGCLQRRVPEEARSKLL